MTNMPESNSEDGLPSGWEERTTDSGFVCYVNQQQKTAQWTHPSTDRSKRIHDKLDVNWVKEFDKEQQRNIFRNTETNQSSFIDPRLALGKEEPPQNVKQVRKRFGSCTNALQVLEGKDLSGRLAVITGCNTGIGYETARSLALHGCEVIFLCRNSAAAHAAIERISIERPAARSRLRFIALDLGSFKSVAQCVQELKQSVQHIDYFILNAGVFGPYVKTEDGLEATFQVSHLSHFYLTTQLESLFDYRSRIVVLASEAHRFANLPSTKLSEEHLSPTSEKYGSFKVYSNAKLCNVLFTQELANRWKNRGISVFSVHPGFVYSEIQRNFWLSRFLLHVVRPFIKSTQQGAATTIYAATANELTGLSGMYLENCYFSKPSKLSQEDEIRTQLWTISEKLVQNILEQQKH